jgi:crotonobetainyl-CoA:carnitine CoA-transferase CaiB-like acyl-CoA transferase
MPGPLEGVRIIDVSEVISGPLAAMILAEQGADVIKVEPPRYGEESRQLAN